MGIVLLLRLLQVGGALILAEDVPLPGGLDLGPFDVPLVDGGRRCRPACRCGSS